MSTMPALIALAQKAALAGEVPVAAAILAPTGELIAQAHNTVEAENDATAHAEMRVLQAASCLLGHKYLENYTLLVTLEPCAMCAAAAAHAKIGKIIFGAYDSKSGGVEHGARIFSHPTCHHVPEVIGGVMASECAALLQDFFRNKRR